MSGSEGKPNNQMSSRDIEEEEMAQELMNMEMYEVGMEFDQMKEILRFINESKDMAGIEPENRSTQEASQYSEEITAAEVVTKNKSPRELIPEETSIPKPSYSYRQHSGRVSPTTSGRKSSLELVPVKEAESVPSPDMFDNEEPNRFSEESESIINKHIKDDEITDKDDVSESRSQTVGNNAWHTVSDSSQNSQNSQSLDTNIDNVKSRKNQRVERWKLDPTNAVVEENDVPLKEKSRPTLKERVPYSFCHNKRVFDAGIRKKVLTVLTHALEEVADIWRRKHRPDVSEFQWGSPIKVGANYRSLDKKPVIEEADSPQRCEILRSNPDSVQRRNMDRNCKRKAAEHIRDLVNDKVSSDEDSDNIFEAIKKQKKSDSVWEPPIRSNVNSAEKGLSRQEKMFNNIQNSNRAKASTSLIQDYDSDDFDNDDLNNLRKKNKKKDEEMGRVSSPEVYPRRIVPPNLNKPKAVGRPRKNGEKHNKKSPVRKNMQAMLEKNRNSGMSVARGKSRNPLARHTNSQNVTLNDDETSNEREYDEPRDTQVEIEIKPMPVRGLASKLQQSTLLLLEKKKAEERLEKAKIQEKRNAEMEEKILKESIQRTRFLKETEERKEREAKDLAIKARDETWKKHAAARDRDRRRKQAQEKKRSLEEKKGLLLMDDEEDVNTVIDDVNVRQISMEERVQCPICLLEFSKGEIQDHAADCNQFDNLDEPGTSASPANDDELIITNDHMIFDCQICSDFSTTNGIIYEQHVNGCVKRKADEMRRQSLSDSPAKEVIEVPTSPIQCFVPISEQTESTINYAEQFGSQKVKPNAPRMKRRR